MLHALGRKKHVEGGGEVATGGLKKVERDRTDQTRDVRDPNKTGQSRRSRIRSTIQTVNRRVSGAVAKGVAVALLLGAMAVPAMAQTTVNEGVPLKPVGVRVEQAEQNLGDRAPLLMQLRAGHTLTDHQQRAGLTYPFLGAIDIPDDAGDRMRIMGNESLWRMITIAAQEAEGSAELTNMIPTSPVAGELMWQPQIEGAGGKMTDVLPLMFPQVARPDGSLDMDKLKALFLRVNNPSPTADASDVFLGENVGFQNGRAGYFSINAINPEPLQPHAPNGTLLLPQLTLEVNGHKTVYTIGSLCYKGGGPSFKPTGSRSSYGYNADRQRAPLNMTVQSPIYAGNTSFGLYSYEANSKVNTNGWMLLDAGAYAGMSIMEFRLDELIDWQLDAGGKVTGEPGPISVAQLQQDGRLMSSQPALLWRAFETEYRLSSFKNADEKVQVLEHMRQLFARDAIFDHIANNDGLSQVWTSASEKARTSGDEADMERVWSTAIRSLNGVIAAGDHSYLRDEIKLDAETPVLTVDDYVRTAIQRSARNVVVLHKLDLNHNSIAAGGDNINAAWQIVDLDDLDPAGRAYGADAKDHPDVNEFTSNLEMMVDDLKDQVPEMTKYEDQMRDLLKQAIDVEQPIYGKPAPQQQGNG